MSGVEVRFAAEASRVRATAQKALWRRKNRKQRRLDKKKRRNEHALRGKTNDVLLQSSTASNSKRSKRTLLALSRSNNNDTEKEDTRIKKKRVTFAFDDGDQQEDEEMTAAQAADFKMIAELEKKLGLGTAKGKARFREEIAADGFETEFLDYLDKPKRLEELPTSRPEEPEEEEKDDDDFPVGNVSFLPKTNLYGEGDKSSTEKEKIRPRIFAEMSGEKLKLKRFLNGVINRLTEATLEPCSSQIRGIYQENSSSLVNECLAEIIFSGLSNEVALLSALATNFAALTVALCMEADDSFGPQILEKSVVRFEKVFEEDRDGLKQDGDERVVSKRASNLAIFLCHLYTFGVCSSRLVYDLLERMLRISVEDAVEVGLAIIGECGARLRKDDPARLLSVISKMTEPNDEESASSPRLQFLFEQINALKNNKVRDEVLEQRVKKCKSVLRQIKNKSGSNLLALRVSWHDLLHAEEKGRWWIVGGVWKQITGQPEESSDGENANGKVELFGSITRALASVPRDILALSKAQGMNTDLKRAIFCEIMASEDVFNALSRLGSLNLNAKQEREIGGVLLTCCSASKMYNPFYAEVAVHLCERKPQFKFTFQVLFWDLFQQLQTDEVIMKPRKTFNFACFLTRLLLRECLALTILKTVEFTDLSDQLIVFMAQLFRNLLCYGGDDKDSARKVAQTFNRLGGSETNFQAVADGMLLFFHSHMQESIAEDSLLKKRVKLAKRIVDALVIKRSLEAEAELMPDEKF